MIDLYSVKPVDADAILAAAGGDRALVTVEDHWTEGGIGETVAGVLAEAAAGTPLVRLAVTERPGSGPPEALSRRPGSMPRTSSPRWNDLSRFRALQAITNVH